VIKQVFPPRLFALFVDVGNYVNEVENYTAVYREYVNMPVNFLLLVFDRTNEYRIKNLKL